MTFDVGDRVVLSDFYCMQRMVVREVLHYKNTEDHVAVFWLDSVGAPHRDIFPVSFLKKENLNE